MKWNPQCLVSGLILAVLLCACGSSGTGMSKSARLGLEKTPAGWASLETRQKRLEAFAMAERYTEFIDKARTVRLAVSAADELAHRAGFETLDLSSDQRLEAGQRVRLTMRSKIFAAVLVADPSEPFRVVVTTIDAPRIDIKQNPLYANSDAVLFDTHFYGAVDKKRWLSVPLALHGSWIHQGELRSIAMGDDPDEPVTVIPDLLPHLSRKIQREAVVSAEGLDAIAGFEELGRSPPAPPEDPGPQDAPAAFLERLKNETGLSESHFVTGEFTLVPAARPSFVGVDRGMVAAYGQRFRCALFAGLEGLAASSPSATTILIALDKAELRHTGNTGLSAVRDILGEIHYRMAPEQARNELGLRRRLHRSRGWVTSEVGGEIGSGIVFNTPRDAALPDTLRWTFDTLDGARVPYQLTSSGGWGSPSRYLSTQGISFMDFSLPVAGHGTPSEIVSVPDLDSMRRAIKAISEAP